jgi:AraC-like DNA-binding protein
MSIMKILKLIITAAFPNQFSALYTFLFVAMAVLMALATQAFFCRRRFRELANAMGNEGNELDKNTAVLSMHPDIISTVLRHLDQFEQRKDYLEKNITLVRLAAMFDSNPTYVSKIILHYKGKRSIEYINDLRIDYVIHKLRQDAKSRNYTNKALSDEAGFATAQHFTRSFNKRVGMSPARFISQLRRSESYSGLMIKRK